MKEKIILIAGTQRSFLIEVTPLVEWVWSTCNINLRWTLSATEVDGLYAHEPIEFIRFLNKAAFSGSAVSYVASLVNAGFIDLPSGRYDNDTIRALLKYHNPAVL